MEYFNKPLHTYTLNLSSQNGILLNKYRQRYHIKLYDFPGEKGKFLLSDISTILNLISILENSREVPASFDCANETAVGLHVYQKGAPMPPPPHVMGKT